MKNEVLVRIYTRPLFDLAVESHNIDAIAAELQDLTGLFEQVPELDEYLGSPNITRSAKLDLLRKAYDRPWSKYFGNFLDLVLRKSRQEILPHAWEAYNRYWDEYRQRLDVKVMSAVELTNAQKEAISQRLSAQTGKQVLLHCELDPNLLGGIRLQIGHQLLDATVAGKLNTLKEQLLQV